MKELGQWFEWQTPSQSTLNSLIWEVGPFSSHPGKAVVSLCGEYWRHFCEEAEDNQGDADVKAPVRFSYLFAVEKDLKTFPCLALFLSAALLNLTFTRWISHVLKGNEISAVLLLLPA